MEVAILVVIFAEKPDIGTRLAATLGGCMIGSTELTPANINKLEGAVKKQRYADGHLKCKFRGDTCVVTWGFGHIAELQDCVDYDPIYKKWDMNVYPCIPEKYIIRVKEEHKAHFARLKKWFKEADLIINATDADREGELIFLYVYQMANVKTPYKRLWISSYTEEAIREGFDNLKTAAEMRPLQDAARSRSEADWVAGVNFTVFATKKFNSEMYSVGRVQTPTLAILVKRELEIRNFVPVPFWELHATFRRNNGETYTGTHKYGRFDKRADAEAILRKVTGKNGIVTVVDQTTEQKPPPLLFDLNSLQMECNSLYGFTADKTLKVAQKLYENQYITYPRTNSRYLPDDQKKNIPGVMAAIKKNHPAWVPSSTPFTKRYFDSSKVESHYAIIPTNKAPDLSSLSFEEQKVYNLIAASLCRAFAPSAEIGKTKATTDVDGELFASEGRVVIKPGWMAIGDVAPTKEVQLPALIKGEAVQGVKYELLDKKTEPPKRYTEKTLLAAMEGAGKLVEDEEARELMKDSGLGTPATRASIIERLIRVQYVRRENKTLIPTEKGIFLIQALPVEEVKSPEMTGAWEKRMNQIARGKDSYDTFIRDIEEFVRRACDTIKTATGSVPPPPSSPNSYSKAASSGSTGKGSKGKGSGKGKSGGKSNTSGGNGMPNNERVEVGKCPQCGKPVTHNVFNGYNFYGCSGYKEGCKFSINGKICGKEITEAQARKILANGRSDLIKGMVGKSGKSFDAYLVMKEDKSGVGFEFPSSN